VAARAARAQLAHRVAEEKERLLGVAEEDRVVERRDRLGPEGARAAADDDRVLLAARRRPDRDLREAEELDDVGVGELVRDLDPEDVRLPHGELVLERDERLVPLAEERLEVAAGQEDALARDLGPRIEQVI